MNQTNLNWLTKEQQVTDTAGSTDLNGEILGTVESSVVAAF